MARAIATARAQFDTILVAREMARFAAVCGCALALAAAGPALPALGL